MKIYSFSGAPSTGKSTLIKELELNPFFKNFNFLPTVSRNLWKDFIKDFNLSDWKNNPPDIETAYQLSLNTIRASQLAFIFKNHSNSFFLDRSFLDSAVYTQIKFQNNLIPKPFYNLIMNQSKENMNLIDLNLILTPEFPISNDNFRNTNINDQSQFNDIMLSLIKDWNLPHHFISGPIPNRISQIINIISSSPS